MRLLQRDLPWQLTAAAGPLPPAVPAAEGDSPCLSGRVSMGRMVCNRFKHHFIDSSLDTACS